MRRPGDHEQKRVPSRSVPVSQAISTRSFEPLDTASKSAPTMTIAVRSKGGNGGSSASRGSGSARASSSLRATCCAPFSASLLPRRGQRDVTRVDLRRSSLSQNVLQ